MEFPRSYDLPNGGFFNDVFNGDESQSQGMKNSFKKKVHLKQKHIQGPHGSPFAGLSLINHLVRAANFTNRGLTLRGLGLPISKKCSHATVARSSFAIACFEPMAPVPQSQGIAVPMYFPTEQ